MNETASVQMGDMPTGTRYKFGDQEFIVTDLPCVDGYVYAVCIQTGQARRVSNSTRLRTGLYGLRIE